MIDMSKKYRTRDDREVRIYAVDGSHPWSVHGAIACKQQWEGRNWTAAGAYSTAGPHPYDLIEIKPERWFPIFFDPNAEPGEVSAWMGCTDYPTKNDAMRLARNGVGQPPVDAWKAPE